MAIDSPEADPSGSGRRIAPPERTGLSGAFVVVATVAVSATLPLLLLLRGPEADLLWPALAAAALFLLALATGSCPAMHVALLVTLIGAWVHLGVWPLFWPFQPLVPLAVYAAVVLAVPSLRCTVGWLRPGDFDRTAMWLVAGIAVVSAAALVLWLDLFQPDLSHFIGAIPNWHPLLLILPGLGFAVLNAAIEEAIFRGVAMQALEAALAAGLLALLLQAGAFGALHLMGIPNGWVGVGMATIYGVALGLLRRHTGGMLAPFAAHVAADVVIFVLLCLTI